MAFEEISKGRFAGRPAIQNRVAIARSNNKQVVIRVSNDIYKSMGAPMFFKVAVGTGQHDGLVALIPARIKSASAYKANVSFHGRGLAHIAIAAKHLSITIEDAAIVPHEVTDDGLVIDVRQLRKPKLAAAE